MKKFDKRVVSDRRATKHLLIFLKLVGTLDKGPYAYLVTTVGDILGELPEDIAKIKGTSSWY